MKLSDFDYNLPKELIAQEPAKPRDHSRLLLLNKKNGAMEHGYFYNIVDYLNKGDVLVLNDSKVFPARLIGKRAGTGGKVEVFLLRAADVGALRATPLRGKAWQCLVGGHRRKVGLAVEFGRGLKAEVMADNGDGTFTVAFNKSGKALMSAVEKIGQTPLPPYIKYTENREQKTENRTRYQTVYADDNKIGSVAAPTAGLHFTPALLNKLRKKGVQIEYITLHVGLGTFAPVKVDDITKHKMHAEWVEIDAGAIKRIAQAKQDGRRIVAVGTTSVRTLEAVFAGVILERPKGAIGSRGASHSQDTTGSYRPPRAVSRMTGFSGWVDIFIYPGYKFKVVDAMVTNFHLPKSTLLMLVSAFAGKEAIDAAYQEAIKKEYRFYSYGDAMLIS